MSLPEKYDHPLYKHVKEEKDADAVAWAWVNKDKCVKFPFKFPPLGPKELRANVLYAGLCHSDVLTVREGWGPAPFPLAPGHEIVAEVSQVGSEVKNYKKGDLVGFGTFRDACEKCRFCKEGREELCGECKDPYTYGTYWGGYATAVQQPADFFFHLPKDFDLAKGAPLFCAGITTFYPMKKYLKEGMKTAVCGIGGLGHVALQFLNKLGYDVTAFTSDPKKVDMIKGLGATRVIISSDPKEMEKVKDSFDFIINTIPTDKVFQKFFNCLQRGGTFVQVGQPDLNENILGVPCFGLILKEANIVGSLGGPRPVIKEMLNICTDKKIYPIVEEFDFEDLPKAFDKLENGKPHFRCVVKTKDYAEKHGLKK